MADWITSADNPYFAKSYVNRLWGYMTGRGIIEPLDDIRAGNPPTNPELLDYLTQRIRQEQLQHPSHACSSSASRARTNCRSKPTSGMKTIRSISRMPAHAACRPKCCTMRFIAPPVRPRRSPVWQPAAARPTLPDVGVELADGFLGNLGRPARESACECERSSNLQLGPVMALVSGPTVGNAISDPENAVAKLVAGGHR